MKRGREGKENGEREENISLWCVWIQGKKGKEANFEKFIYLFVWFNRNEKCVFTFVPFEKIT